MCLSVTIQPQCLADPPRQGLERLGWNVPVVYVKARVNRGFLIWEIQLVKEGSLHMGYVEIHWLWPSLPGEQDANLEDNPEVGQWF